MHKFRISTIRARLLVSFVVIALLPVIGVGIGTGIVSYQNGRQEAIDRLGSVAALKELSVDNWVRSLHQELVMASQTDCSPKYIHVVLRLARDDKVYAFYNRWMRKRLQAFVEQSAQVEELFLLDLQGVVVLSTQTAREGKIYADQDFFRQGLDGSYTRLPFSGDDGFLDGNYLPADRRSVIAALPVIDQEGQVLGVIAGRTGVRTIQDLLSETTGLGRTGKAYLVDSDYALLAESRLTGNPGSSIQEPISVRTEGIEQALASKTNGYSIYPDYRGTSVIGVYRWLPDIQVVLSVEQDLSEAFLAIFTTVGINLGIALLTVLVAAFLSLFITRSIADPVVNLAETAAQIANGDLDRVAPVERDDEIGVLARAFNSMTAQLRELIDSLERRVEERTGALQEANRDLQRRALQLETNAQLGREITSILDIDDLLPQVVEMIRDAFRYYHVHIYLLDQEAEELVLRASTSQALGLEHQRLQVRTASLNGKVTQTGRAHLVNDVTEDPHFLPDEQLPETRSELVIPLRLGDQVIGTLDVHSAEVNAFMEEDLLVIQSLGDQIAIAIENARLYDRSRELAVLEERTRLARELHDSVTQSLYSLVLLAEGWRRMVNAGDKTQIEDYLARIGEIAQQALKEMRLLIHELHPPLLEREGLVGALRQRIEAVEKRVGIEARVLMEELIELPASVEEGLFRIAQEALNNALKHADATAVTVRIRPKGEEVLLEVTDNGKGFDLEGTRRGGGMGLRSMRQRAIQMGGTLTIVTAPGQGTTIRAAVPATPED